MRLNNNVITRVEKDAFVNCTSLQELNMSANKLDKLGAAIFYSTKTPNLSQLWVSIDPQRVRANNLCRGTSHSTRGYCIKGDAVT